ncbi:MAG TPA: helix-turn-helix domain-containing protein [Chloroflexota bacterium]
MAPRLSYEPSAQSVLGHLILPGGRIVGNGASLRKRVSWPVVLRASGLGDLFGGELIIASEAHTERLLRSLDALRETGVAAILIVTRDVPEQVIHLENPAIPLGISLTTQPLQQVQTSAEQFLIRRRRELYGFTQNLHHSLIDAAIGGADLAKLLHAAGQNGALRATYDSEGDVLSDGPPLSRADLVACRISAHGLSTGTIMVETNPRCIAAPVMAGNERRGLIVVPADAGLDLDELELVAETLSQACAIALARVRSESVPTLEQVLVDLPGARDAQWQVAAVSASDVSSSRIARAITAELASIHASVFVGRDNDAVFAVVTGTNELKWPVIADNLSMRLGARDLRVGVGRLEIGPKGADRSSRQASQAMARQREAGCTLFQEIEVETLLESVVEWEPFVRARLGPLMDDRAGRKDLLRTLEVYLDSGSSVAAAARILSVHRNTVLYRLSTLQQLLGTSLDDGRDVFALSLALRLYRLHQRAL